MKNNQKQEIKNKINKELKIILGSILAIALVAGTFFYLGQKSSTENSVAETSTLSNLTREFSHKTGPDNAKVKIVEFYDPECEACSAFFPYVKEILKSYKNDIQLTTRYALYHGNSLLAAKSSDAAAIQGKFWEYQEKLFMTQHEWSHKQEPSTSYFVQYAQDLGLDVAKFKTDMEDLKRMETINIDLEDGKNLGVNGTPTIFINGNKLINLSPDSFKEMVEAELKK